MFSPTDPKVPPSLAYHLADIYLDELNKALSAPSSKPAPLTTLLAPFVELAARTPSRVVFGRVRGALLEGQLAGTLLDHALGHLPR